MYFIRKIGFRCFLFLTFILNALTLYVNSIISTPIIPVYIPGNSNITHISAINSSAVDITNSSSDNSSAVPPPANITSSDNSSAVPLPANITSSDNSSAVDIPPPAANITHTGTTNSPTIYIGTNHLNTTNTLPTGNLTGGNSTLQGNSTTSGNNTLQSNGTSKENFNSQARYGHTSNLINQKIYVIGGKNATAFTNDALVLDFSSNSLDTIVININSVSLNFSVAWGTSVDDGTNIFYFGGVTSNNNLNAKIIQFDTEQNQLSSITFDALNPPSARRGLNSVLENGRWHIYGGSSNIDDDPYSLMPNNDTFVHYLTLKTKKFTDLSTYLKTRFDYTATILGNNIIYIGGQTTSGFIGMEEIWMFQTDEMQWLLLNNLSNPALVPNRGGHTAVKLSNNSLLIYGGYSDPNSVRMNNNNAVALFSLQNYKDFIWTLPIISYQNPLYQNQPIPYWHTATIYNNNNYKYMIVAYGKFDTTINNTQLMAMPVTILNVSNDISMQWVQLIITQSPDVPENRKINIGLIKQKVLKDDQIQDSNEVIQATQNLPEMIQESNSINPEMIHQSDDNEIVQSHQLPEKIAKNNALLELSSNDNILNLIVFINQC
ncbi:13481_t:CDS:2 [Ambispora leptoticha]|uniref:13481_t:CDS:1 n=1 Tax=Ambispora leptoticha TaxID=144679 RepID=A0A9N8W4L5_9GLOM|nr:13481_t:CDS:2 [Ambispora leptoticha]